MGGFAVPHQNGLTGEASETYVTAPGGTTLSWTGTVGVFLTRRLSLEGEVSKTGMMRARVPSRYLMTFDEERRDWFFAGNLRFHLRPGARLDLEPVGGLVITRHQGWSQTEYASLFPPSTTTTVISDRMSTMLPTSLGMNAGIDLRAGGPRFAVVPSLRIRGRFAILGDNSAVSWYPNGFPHWTISPALNARIDF